MGVRGLLGYILQHREECVEYIDLVERAREPPYCENGGLEILVDYFCFEKWLYERLLRGVAPDNLFARVCGGEYWVAHEGVQRLQQDLAAVNIRLVWIVDGSKGSSNRTWRRKLPTWKQRHSEDINRVNRALQMCAGLIAPLEYTDDIGVRPTLLRFQILKSLREVGAEVIQLAFGEADYTIAQALTMRSNAVAVLSNDSDFALFRDSVFVPFELFDIENDIGLNSSSSGVSQSRPLRLLVGAVSTLRVMKSLHLKEWRQLVQVGMLSGVELTQGELPRGGDWLPKLGVRFGGGSAMVLPQIADAVANAPNGDAMKLEPVHSHLEHNPRFRAACQEAEQYYGLLCSETEAQYLDHQLSHYLEAGVQEGRLPSQLIPPHLGFKWHQVLLEDLTPGHPVAAWAMQPIRERLYALLLDRKQTTQEVEEWGRGNRCEIERRRVRPARDALKAAGQDGVNAARLHRVEPWRTESSHTRILDACVGYLERNCSEKLRPASLLRLYGSQRASVLMTLRYLLLLCWRRELWIQEKEFVALAAAVLGVDSVRPRWYSALGLRPSVRCVTISSWFQELANLVCCQIMSLLYTEQPEPRGYFSGCVFTAFFMIHAHTNGAPLTLEADSRRQIERDFDRAFRNCRQLISLLTEDIFTLNC